MYASRVACCPLVSDDECDDETDIQTDGQMPDRYIKLSAMDAANIINTNTN